MEPFQPIIQYIFYIKYKILNNPSIGGDIDWTIKWFLKRLLGVNECKCFEAYKGYTLKIYKVHWNNLAYLTIIPLILVRLYVLISISVIAITLYIYILFVAIMTPYYIWETIFWMHWTNANTSLYI